MLLEGAASRPPFRTFPNGSVQKHGVGDVQTYGPRDRRRPSAYGNWLKARAGSRSARHGRRRSGSRRRGRKHLRAGGRSALDDRHRRLGPLHRLAGECVARRRAGSSRRSAGHARMLCRHRVAGAERRERGSQHKGEQKRQRGEAVCRSGLFHRPIDTPRPHEVFLRSIERGRKHAPRALKSWRAPSGRPSASECAPPGGRPGPPARVAPSAASRAVPTAGRRDGTWPRCPGAPPPAP